MTKINSFESQSTEYVKNDEVEGRFVSKEDLEDMEEELPPASVLTNLREDFTELTRGLALSDDIDGIQCTTLGLYSEEERSVVFSREEQLNLASTRALAEQVSLLYQSDSMVVDSQPDSDYLHEMLGYYSVFAHGLTIYDLTLAALKRYASEGVLLNPS